MKGIVLAHNFFPGVILLTLLLVFSSSVQGAEQVLQVAGCKTGSILLNNLSKEKNSGLDFAVRSSSTGNKIGMQLLLDKKIPLAVTCKTPEILAKKFPFIADKLSDISYKPFARDTWVIIVHPDNPISDISMKSLQKIYLGEIQNWQELGGTQGPIWPLRLNPQLGSGFSKLFQEYIIGLNKNFAPHVRLMRSPRIASDYVKKFKNTISYSSFSDISPSVKTIALDGIMPTKESLSNGRYPVGITYYLVTLGKPTGKAKAFTEYLASPTGQEAVDKFCFPYVNAEITTP